MASKDPNCPHRVQLTNPLCVLNYSPFLLTVVTIANFTVTFLMNMSPYIFSDSDLYLC